MKMYASQIKDIMIILEKYEAEFIFVYDLFGSAYLEVSNVKYKDFDKKDLLKLFKKGCFLTKDSDNQYKINFGYH